MKNVANWIAENPIVAAGALIGFIALVAVIGIDGAMTLLNTLAGE